MILVEKLAAIFLMSLVGFNPVKAFAHAGGHGPPPMVAECKAKDCTESEIEAGALKLVPMMAEASKLDLKSWQAITKATSTEKIDVRQPGMGQKDITIKLWKVHIANAKEPEVSKRNFYIFISERGELAGANFDGQIN